MRSLFLLVAGLTFSAALHAQAIISTLSLSTSNPTNCTNTTASISLTLYCANYTYTGYTITTSGSNITIQLDYTVGLICLPALQYPTVTVPLGQLPAGAITVTATAYLNSTFSSQSAPINTTVISCCGAVAAFVPSEDTICQGDSVTMTNNTTNADSVKWYQDWNLVDTAFNPTMTFDSAGAIEVSLVAFSDTCNDTTEHIILVYSAPQIDLGNDTSICIGSSLDLSIASGLTNILWSDGSTNTTNSFNAVGTYWVTALSNQGCVGSDTLDIISVLPISTIDLGADPLICPGTSTSLSPSSSYVNYLWSTGDTTASVSVSNTGIYWLEANAAGECPGRDTVEVFHYSIIPLAFTQDSNKCGNNTIGTFGSYASYQWSTGSFSDTTVILDSTVITLTVTDGNGCVQTDSAIMPVWPVPVVNLGSDTVYCPGEELILESNVAGATYAWSTGSTSSLIAVTSAGTYSLIVTSELGCVGSDEIIIDYCVGLDELPKTGISVFPNPTLDQLRVSGNHQAYDLIQVVDPRGKVWLESKWTPEDPNVSMEALPSGVYWLILSSDSRHSAKTQVLKL